MQRRALRTFKLTRIKRLRSIPGEFPDEALACVADETAEIQSDMPPIRFTLRIDASMAFRVYDDFEEDQLSQAENGDFIAHAAFMPGEWLISFILGWERTQRCSNPRRSRTQFAANSKKMLALYKT